MIAYHKELFGITSRIESKCTSQRYIEAIQDMYNRVSTNIHTPVSITESFPTKVGLHQGSTLSHFIFTVIIQEISKLIWDTVQ